MCMSHTLLNISEYQKLASLAGIGTIQECVRIKEANNIDRISTDKGVFFCKTYTKTWYGRSDQTGYCVLHERGAYETLASHQLRVPEVVLFDESSANPLGKPFLFLRKLEGNTILECRHQGMDVKPLLCSAGSYLRTMHSIVFSHPGYVTCPAGPDGPPIRNQWRHRIWEIDVLESQAAKLWEQAVGSSGGSLLSDLTSRFAELRERIGREYTPPRMAHGDCHMDQFFFQNQQVTGVLDMEVASAGDTVFDLVKFAIEASANPPVDEWWKPFFEGYGAEPDFETFKLRLLCCEYPEFAWQKWSGTHVEILTRLFHADGWSSLLKKA